MSANAQFAKVFQADLSAMADGLSAQAEAIWQEAAQTAAEAVVVGNGYGPGVPVDTGFLRASFRLGVNAPQDGERVPPSGLPPGAGLPAQLDLSVIARAVLGETIYLTTIAEYASYLEAGTWSRGGGSGTFNRRTAEQQLKDQKGTLGPTPFIEPVLARWQAIVDDAARRVSRGT